MNPLLIQFNNDIDTISQNISTAENLYLSLNGKYYQSQKCGSQTEVGHISIIGITDDLPMIDVANDLQLEIEIWEEQREDERGFTIFFRTQINGRVYQKTYSEGISLSTDWQEITYNK